MSNSSSQTSKCPFVEKPIIALYQGDSFVIFCRSTTSCGSECCSRKRNVLNTLRQLIILNFVLVESMLKRVHTRTLRVYEMMAEKNGLGQNNSRSAIVLPVITKKEDFEEMEKLCRNHKDEIVNFYFLFIVVLINVSIACRYWNSRRLYSWGGNQKSSEQDNSQGLWLHRDQLEWGQR